MKTEDMVLIGAGGLLLMGINGGNNPVANVVNSAASTIGSGVANTAVGVPAQAVVGYLSSGSQIGSAINSAEQSSGILDFASQIGSALRSILGYLPDTGLNIYG